MPVEQDQVEGRIAGIPIKIKGLNMAVFLALVGITTFTIWTLYDAVLERQRAMGTQITAEHSTISRSIELQTTAIEKQTEAIFEQNYILLADTNETAELRKAYRRPDSLRRKLGQ